MIIAPFIVDNRGLVCVKWYDCPKRNNLTWWIKDEVDLGIESQIIYYGQFQLVRPLCFDLDQNVLVQWHVSLGLRWNRQLLLCWGEYQSIVIRSFCSWVDKCITVGHLTINVLRAIFGHDCFKLKIDCLLAFFFGEVYIAKDFLSILIVELEAFCRHHTYVLGNFLLIWFGVL